MEKSPDMLSEKEIQSVELCVTISFVEGKKEYICICLYSCTVSAKEYVKN